MSYWFLRFSPDGLHVAGGHEVLQEDDIVLGMGAGPRYSDSNTIFYGRQPDGAFMRWDRGRGSSVVRAQGFNFYDVAPDGRWVGYRTDPPRLIWHDGNEWVGWADGDLSNTRWAAREHHNSALWAGLGQGQEGRLIDPRGCSDVRLLGNVLTWSVGDEIYGQREHLGKIENWSIEGQSHFWPVPVWVGGKLYVMTHTFDTLMLYEAKEKQTHGWIINVGISDFPDVVALDARRVRIGWTDKGVKHERVLDLVLTPQVDLRPPKEEPAIEDTSGRPIDPLPYMFGDLPQRDGDHYMCWYVDQEKRRWYEIKFGKPDQWEAFYWDTDKIGLWEDRSQSEPRYNPGWDYSYTEDVMFMRPMKPGVKIAHENNEWIRFDPRNNTIIDRGPLRFHQWIGRVYLSYPFGGDVGTRAGFESNSQAVGEQHMERNIYAFGAGRCVFQIVRVDTDQVVFQTKFVKAGGPRLTPTVGGRDANIANWPPPKQGGNKVGVTFQSPSFPLNIKVGERPQFVLKRDGEWPARVRWWRRGGSGSGPKDVTEWRNPQHDPDHTWDWPGEGSWEVGIEWDGGGTGTLRLVNVAAQGGGGGNPGGSGVLPGLDEMSDLHHRLEYTYEIDPGRHPQILTRVDAGGRIGWTHNYLGRRARGVGHEPAVRGVENMIDEIEGRPPRWAGDNGGGGPIDPPPGDLDRIDGQLGLEPGGGFHVNGRAVLPTLAHYGDALSKWMRDPDHVLRNLDLITSVGYHGVRYWTCLDGSWWNGRHVGEAFQPNYWERHRAFFIALKERGLVAQISQGSTTRDALPDPHGFMHRLCDTLQDVGPEVCCVLEGVNEDRDTGNKGPRWLADFVGIARARFPNMLLGLSSYTGTEDPIILNQYSIDPANMFMVHPYRGGHNHDKTRHLMSLQYENGANARAAMAMMSVMSSRMTNEILDDIVASRVRTALETAEYLMRYFPHRQDEIEQLLMVANGRSSIRSAMAREAERLMRRNGWNSEGPGGGNKVSAIDNREAITGATMAGFAAMSFAMRMAYVWFSGWGVWSDEPGQELEVMPGFREVPQVRKYVPADIMRYSGPIFHGGETWRDQRTFSAMGDTRADHVIHSDGRRLVMIYGPSGLDVPQHRGLNVEVDQRWGNEFRLVFGRE